jgi:molecular chaperone HtpG
MILILVRYNLTQRTGSWLNFPFSTSGRTGEEVQSFSPGELIMEETPESNNLPPSNPIHFKAETRQLLNILVHSLYTDREIFLRELISNASDALTRVDFEMLTNREVLDHDSELAIRITPDPEQKTLTISDTGIGMTAEELAENLGTIAHSGARAFVEAVEKGARDISDIIGQFGVGFYSAFMVAEWIKVISRSFRPEAQAAAWFSTGADTFTIEPAEKTERGTTVIIKLKEDVEEFVKEYRLREIIRKHSDFVAYPIYLGSDQQQANRQTAIWRQSPRQVEQDAYEEFYKQLTLDHEPPLAHAHMVVDAPVQMYALLFVPSKLERGLLSPRRDDGLKLYSHKILIQEYNKELVPEYLRFVEGVVDSEDLPLNVSRESVQANRVMAQLKKLVTSKILDTLKEMARSNQEKYIQFWDSFGRAIKQGVAVDQGDVTELYPLLRFHTTAQPSEWSSLEDYVKRMKDGQKEIYYLLGDDERSIQYSPHLDLIRKHDYEVLLLTDPLDSFMLVRLQKYEDRTLVNIANANLNLPEDSSEGPVESAETLSDQDHSTLIERFKSQLGDRVADVRMTDRLSDSPARLVDSQGAPNLEMQRVYRLLNKDFTTPKKILELNRHHSILERLGALEGDHPLNSLIIEQIFEDALLIEGLHPDPASMITRIQKIIEAALD